MNEFDIIARYFVPLTMNRKESANLQDDAAVLAIPDGCELAVTSDTLNAGVHFPEGESPENIARKALRVNLSDLAAMGADPLCYQLGLSFPEKPAPAWLQAFTGALLADQETYGLYCSGGDTTSLQGRLSITITALGTVPKGKALRRSGAKTGDALVLTGSVGDACLGLKALKEGQGERYPRAVSRYRVPEPRLEAVAAIRQYARAACDISDGVLADIGHICATSGLGVEIERARMHFSPELTQALACGIVTLEEILCGGDDYELALGVPPGHVQALLVELKKINLNPQVIGYFRGSTSGVRVFDTDGADISVNAMGWRHF